MRVLVVDGQKALYEQLQANYPVIMEVVATYEQALDCLRRASADRRFDLVIIDYYNFRMAGHRACTRKQAWSAGLRLTSEVRNFGLPVMHYVFPCMYEEEVETRFSGQAVEALFSREAGAIAWLSKSTSDAAETGERHVFWEAMKSVARHVGWYEADVVREAQALRDERDRLEIGYWQRPDCSKEVGMDDRDYPLYIAHLETLRRRHMAGSLKQKVLQALQLLDVGIRRLLPPEAASKQAYIANRIRDHIYVASDCRSLQEFELRARKLHLLSLSPSTVLIPSLRRMRRFMEEAIVKDIGMLGYCVFNRLASLCRMPIPDQDQAARLVATQTGLEYEVVAASIRHIIKHRATLEVCRVQDLPSRLEFTGLMKLLVTLEYHEVIPQLFQNSFHDPR